MMRQHRRGKNSTIKEEQEPFNNHALQNDSSISIHEDNDAHYYDLDYSDENINQGLVSSSDQNQREITHEEFMQMIVKNQQRHQIKSQRTPFQSQQSPQKQQHLYYHYHRQHNNKSKQVHSNQFKRSQNNKNTPETRDKSYQFHSYGINKLHKQVRIDPEKSSQPKNNFKNSKQISFTNTQNSVRQFRIDSFLNAHSQLPKTRKNQLQNEKKRTQIFQKNKQDQSFSLITLPEYDDQEYCSNDHKQNQNINENISENLKNKRNLKKYQNIAKINNEDDSQFQKLNWRYQEAKLKFMDNFLPDPLKIGSNTYNMFKYMNKKQQLAYNILKM